MQAFISVALGLVVGLAFTLLRVLLLPYTQLPIAMEISLEPDVKPEGGRKMAKDPVCGMDVDPKTATLKSEYKGQTYYFCSSGCKASFDKDPEKYVGTHAQPHSGHH